MDRQARIPARWRWRGLALAAAASLAASPGPGGVVAGPAAVPVAAHGPLVGAASGGGTSTPRAPAAGSLDPPVLQSLDRPVLESFEPPAAPLAGGTVVTISGSFPSHTRWVVTFGDVAAADTVVDEPWDQDPTIGRRARATAPPHAAGMVELGVRGPDGRTVAFRQPFAYLRPPTVAAVRPESGPELPVPAAIGGSGFDQIPGHPPEVLFGGRRATVSGSGVHEAFMLVTTPAYEPGTPRTVDVSVVDAAGQAATLPAAFTYEAGPSGGRPPRREPPPAVVAHHED